MSVTLLPPSAGLPQQTAPPVTPTLRFSRVG
jgi:hypothetical protein